ncbi:MAG: hypothetical protein PQJ61_00440 [Spirochaetales bacterium]|uniref:Uncharacterized protein n=1 Tax=Candidatus Thalassospirochaeta sargassi TaxID=3119039 RepID=A0AAJ1MIV9_9SPIO|nr:hypothetical protein [Spirochaetales bacterium]
MSGFSYAIRLNEQINPIHVIEANLIKKEIYNRRKPLRGEHTSRGVIVSGSKTTGTISCRLTNSTTPPLLYLITGREIASGHVPETRGLYWRKLEIEYDNPPKFSLIEITESVSFEYPELTVKGFSITQNLDSPLKLSMKVETEKPKTEVILLELLKKSTESFFYLSERTRIISGETRTVIDYPVKINASSLSFKAKSSDEYEPNRFGCFGISFGNMKFQDIYDAGNEKSQYRHGCYGHMEVTTYFMI